MELKSQVQAIQKFSRFEHPKLVQELFLQELLQRLGIQGCDLEKCVSRQSGTILPNRRLRDVEFKNTSGLKHTERLHIVLRTESCWKMLRSYKYFLANCFQMPLSEKTPKVVLNAVYTCQYISVHRWITSSFLFLCQGAP